MGYASALAWILFIIVIFFTLIQFRVAKTWVYYESESMADE
jgi:multiple sugar transport system permease protein